MPISCPSIGTALRRVSRLVRLFAWGMGLLCGATVWAQDHITEKSWVEDVSGQWTWPEVTQQPTRPYDGVLSQGFGEGVIWLRLRIDPQPRASSSRPSDSLVLRIRPVYLDNIQVFDPLAPGGKAGVTGDLQHPREQRLAGLDFLMPIARGEMPRDIWLRLQSTSTRQIAVQALNVDDLQRITQAEQLAFALYIGAILVFMVWGLVNWLFSREQVIAAFAMQQATALVYALIALGYARAFWPASWSAQWLDQTTSLFSILAVSSAIYFHLLLIKEFDPHPWMARLHHSLLALLCVKLPLLFVAGQPLMALRINMIEVLLGPFVFLVSVLLARGWSQSAKPLRPILGRTTVVGFYGLLLLILLTASLPGLGVANGGEIPLFLVQAHGLLTAFLILLMLQYRAHMQQKQQHEIALALERSELQAQQERQVREEQEKLLAMLSHELKTPLATMHMRLDANASGAREIKQAIRDMTGVIERCQHTLQLSDRQLKPQLETIDMAYLVRDAITACAQPQRIEVELPAQLLVRADAQLCAIVLNNLLENACKYAAPDTPIRLNLARSEGPQGLRLEIRNQAGRAGLPDGNKLFEKYYRSPYARRQAGTGLGLYLVRNLMQVMGGRIDYAPTADQVRFVLHLPFNSAST